MFPKFHKSKLWPKIEIFSKINFFQRKWILAKKSKLLTVIFIIFLVVRKSNFLRQHFDQNFPNKNRPNFLTRKIMTLFFRWVQTSVTVSANRLQKFFGHIGLILKLRDVKIWSSFFFSKIIRKKCEKSTLKIPCLMDINWRSVKNLTFLIGNLAILEIQDRFKNYYFQQLWMIWKKWWSDFYIHKLQNKPCLTKTFL